MSMRLYETQSPKDAHGVKVFAIDVEEDGSLVFHIDKLVFAETGTTSPLEEFRLDSSKLHELDDVLEDLRYWVRNGAINHARKEA